jgi:hypothetical protein
LIINKEEEKIDEFLTNVDTDKYLFLGIDNE